MDEGAGMQDCVHQAAGDSSRALRAVSEETPCPEVKPCPFCGAEPTENAIEPHTHHLLIDGVPVMPDHGGSHVIECACGAGMIADTRDAVLAIWNRRPLQSQGREVPTGHIGWQPIETAPEDGTLILLLVMTRRGNVLPLTGRSYGSFWAILNADEAIQRVHPTHWMPLPAPPTSGASSSMDAAPATGQSLSSEAAKPLASSGPDEPTPASLLLLLQQAAEARKENAELRQYLCDVLKALNNGSGAAPTASLQFLSWIPKEVEMAVAELRQRMGRD